MKDSSSMGSTTAALLHYTMSSVCSRYMRTLPRRDRDYIPCPIPTLSSGQRTERIHGTVRTDCQSLAFCQLHRCVQFNADLIVSAVLATSDMIQTKPRNNHIRNGRSGRVYEASETHLVDTKIFHGNCGMVVELRRMHSEVPRQRTNQG